MKKAKWKRTIKRIVGFTMVFLMIVPFLLRIFSIKANAAPKRKPIIIVIDAGHGGASTGAEYFGLEEKDLNLVIARSLKATLEKFNDVEVYMTRKKDIDSSFSKRVDYAAAKKANYLISIHLNESEDHNRTGCEIMVPSDSKLSKKVMPMAEAVTEAMEEIGIIRGGIYSEVDEDGKDYYGLLRQASKNKIPTMIIEHLYMDREEYLPYFNNNDILETIGQRDAFAIARALKLSSPYEEYSFENEPDIEYEQPLLITEKSFYPEAAELYIKESKQVSDTSCEITFGIKGTDSNHPLVSYRLSKDGGKTFGDSVPLNNGGTAEFHITAQNTETNKYIVWIENDIHLMILSNMVNVFDEVDMDPDFSKKQEEEPDLTPIPEFTTEFTDEDEEFKGIYDKEPKINGIQSVVAVFGAVAGLFACFFLFLLFRKEKK